MKCQYCNRTEFKSSKSFGAHLTNCKTNPKRLDTISKIKKSKILQIETTLICPKCQISFIKKLRPYETNKIFFCSRRCANSRGPRSQETKDKISSALKQPEIASYCIVCKNLTTNKRRKTCSRKCQNKLVEDGIHKSLKKMGGYREKGGRGKQGRYDGIWFQSTWELAFYLYHKEHGNNILKLTSQIFFVYEFENKKKKFYPDFLVDGKLFEVKGPQDPYKEYKKQASLGIVTFLEEGYLREALFPYIEERYGKIEDLHNLYD